MNSISFSQSNETSNYSFLGANDNPSFSESPSISPRSEKVRAHQQTLVHIGDGVIYIGGASAVSVNERQGKADSLAGAPRTAHRAPRTAAEALGEGEGTGAMSSESVTPRELDARLEAVEARMSERLGSIEADSKILLTTMTTLAQNVRDLKNDIGSIRTSNSSVKSTVIGTGLALAALIVALYAIGFQVMEFIRSAVFSK